MPARALSLLHILSIFTFIFFSKKQTHNIGIKTINATAIFTYETSRLLRAVKWFTLNLHYQCWKWTLKLILLRFQSFFQLTGCWGRFHSTSESTHCTLNVHHSSRLSSLLHDVQGWFLGCLILCSSHPCFSLSLSFNVEQMNFIWFICLVSRA